MLHRLVLILALVLPAIGALPQAARAQLDARDMELCRQDCMARARDASDPRYRSCVASRCQGQTVRRAQTPRRNTPKPAAAAPVGLPLGVWKMGDHPAVGAGLLMQSEQGVLALACSPEGVAIRATNGLFRAASLGWITDTGSAGGTVALAPGAVYSQTSMSACAMGAAGLAPAESVVLVDAPVTARGAGMGFAVGLAAGEMSVMSGSEALARVPGARLMPTEGLAAGLGSLAAQCPALAEALRNPCP
jgi:hypothetical protein